ncbi:MAG: hypothetical protein U9R01_09640 [candidate division WOR-3 bacterium]|nr:hypothetical protein [candidate division WOR-3 bacterium]
MGNRITPTQFLALFKGLYQTALRHFKEFGQLLLVMKLLLTVSVTTD